MKLMYNGKGFTLIEMMVATVMLVIGLLGVSVLLTSTYRQNADSKRITAASTLAEKKLEEIRSAGFASASSSTSPVNNTIDNTTYSVSWVVTTVDATWLKKIDVTVTWLTTKQVALSAYLLK